MLGGMEYVWNSGGRRMHARFLLFGKSRQSMARVGNVLVGAGYTFTAHTDEISSLLRTIRSVEPDLLIMDPPETFHEAARILQIIEEEMLASVVLLVGYQTREMELILDKSPIIGWIPMPIQEDVVIPIVSQCVKTFRHMNAQQREIVRVRKVLEERRTLERAKWIIGHQMNLTESESYDIIRNRSRDTRQPMGKVAEAIILTADFLRPSPPNCPK